MSTASLSTLRENEVRIPCSNVTLCGDLAIPAGAKGLVIFAHGSGSSRLSSRNRWVAEVLRLTRLAPDIVQAILDGRQPRHLNLHAVRGRQTEVPVDWDEQRRLFGFRAENVRKGD